MDPTQNCIERCGRFLTNTRKKLLLLLKGGGLGFGISILKLLSVNFLFCCFFRRVTCDLWDDRPQMALSTGMFQLKKVWDGINSWIFEFELCPNHQRYRSFFEFLSEYLTNPQSTWAFLGFPSRLGEVVDLESVGETQRLGNRLLGQAVGRVWWRLCDDFVG